MGQELPNPQDIIDKEIKQQAELERKNLENNYNELNDDIQKNPEDINKIDKNVMKSLGEYLKGNETKATEMLFNILESLKDPDKKLGNRDEKSLNAIQDLIIENKYSDLNKVGEYQLNKDIFNQDFDFSKMKQYGSFFQSGNTNDWFKNIPEIYTDGSNPKVSDFCKDKYFSQSQFVKGLSAKNAERRNGVVKDLKEYDIIKFITDSQTETKAIDIEKLKKGDTDVYKNFPNIDGYWEFNDLINDPKTNGFLAEWNKKIEDKTAVGEVEVTENKLFTSQEILDKYDGKDKNEVINFNKNNKNSKFNDIVDVIKQNSDNQNSFKLIEYLNTGDLKGFQTEVYGDKLVDSKFKNDGKFGQETLRLTKEYLSPPIARLEPITLDNSKISSPNEIPRDIDIADVNPVEKEETAVVEDNNVENSNGRELVLTEYDLENFHSNQEEYDEKVKELSKSRKGIKIDLGEYQGTISSIDGGLEVDTLEGSSIRASLKEVKKDKIIIYGEGGTQRIIYNHGEYADMSPNERETEYIAENNPQQDLINKGKI